MLEDFVNMFESADIFNIKTEIKNEEETKQFGLALAEKLVPGDVIALIGDLGTGKTTLTKYIAEGLGIEEVIVSPTFQIVREYRSGRLPLFHFDVYRVYDPDELFEIGAEEYIFGDGVSIVEWADLSPELIPDGAIEIRLSYGINEGERVYEVSRKEG